MSKTNWKRSIAILALAAFLVGAMLTGCSTATPTAAPTQPNATASPIPTLAPVILTQYVTGMGQTDMQAVLDEMNKILQDKIHATLVLQLFDWGTYDQKLQAIIASGTAYDMCFTSSWMNNFYSNVDKGAFLEMDDLIAKYAKPAYDAIPVGYWDALKLKGKIYGFINYQIAANQSAFAIRKDIASELGIDISGVKTLEDLSPLLAAVKANRTDLSPVDYQMIPNFCATAYGYEALIGSDIPAAIYINETDGKVMNQFASPEYKSMLTIARDWYLKGYYPKDIATLTDFSALKQSGKFVVLFEGTYKPGGLAELAAATGVTAADYTEVRWGPVYTGTGGPTGTLTAISKNSPNPDRAMMYLNEINTNPELFNLLCFGIKDKHYTVDAGGYVAPIENSGYNPGTDWMFGNQFNALYRVGNEKGNWEKTIELNNSAVHSPIQGFTVDTTPIKDKIAQCQAIVKEYAPLLNTGSADIDVKLPEFLAALETAGAADIIAEMQKQVDAWKASR